MDKIISFLGINPIKTVADAVNQFIKTPDEKAAFELELLNAKNLDEKLKRDFNLALITLEFKDISSAREMNTSVNESGSSSWLSKNITALIALTYIGFSMTMFILILLGYSNTTDTTTNNILMYINGINLFIVGFYFGSSISSRQKTELMLQDKNL